MENAKIGGINDTSIETVAGTETTVEVVDLEKENVELKEEIKKLKKEYIRREEINKIIRHDLRSPISAVCSEIEMALILLREGDTKDSVHLMDGAYETTKKIINLLDQLREWESLKNQTNESKKEEIDVSLVVIEAFGVYDSSAKLKNITLNNEIKEGVKIYSNINVVYFCIRNLINNAIKFTKEGGVVRVYSEKENDSIRIFVSDNGVGMKPENARDIFNKLGETELGTNGERGSGFGLCACKEMIEKMGGQISAESDGEGKGSTFKIILPNNKE